MQIVVWTVCREKVSAERRKNFSRVRDFVLEGLCDRRSKDMLEIDKALFRKQCSRFAPLLSRRMLFQALRITINAKGCTFFTEEGIQLFVLKGDTNVTQISFP